MCEHKELKYFSETDNVICMKCGKVWSGKINELQTIQPIRLPSIYHEPPFMPHRVWYGDINTGGGLHYA